jgi:hypothetical protein
VLGCSLILTSRGLHQSGITALTMGGWYKPYAVQSGIWVPHSLLGIGENHEKKICWSWRLQDVPDANWLLISSPTFNYLNPIRTVALL